MSTLLISQQGSRLTKRGHSLILFKDRKQILVYPLSNVEHILLLGRIEFSASLIGLLLREGIDIVFLTVDGRYKGRLCGPSSKNVFLRQMQYARLQDATFRLNFSKAVVQGKALNQMRLINRQSALDQPELKERWRNFERSVRKADTLSLLRGLEGSFSVFYFRWFQEALKYRMGFQKRIKHPPPDPVNILLSLGYTLLFNSLYGLIEGYGFDPYVGFFHDLSYGHPALVSDLMEEFRAPIVDRLVLNVINRRQIREKHFERQDETYKLTREGLEIFLHGYRKHLLERRMFKEEKINFLQIMQKQVQHFRKFLQGKVERYESFRAR